MKYHIKEIGGVLFLADAGTSDPPRVTTALTGILNQLDLDRAQLARLTGKPVTLIGRWFTGSATPDQEVLRLLRDYKPRPPAPAPTPQQRFQDASEPPTEPYGLTDDLEFYGFLSSTDHEALQGIVRQRCLDAKRLARIVDCGVSTVYSWLNGTRSIPETARAILYEYLLLHPPQAALRPPGARLDINRVLGQPTYSQRATGHAHGYRQLIMYYNSAGQWAERATYIPVLSATWTRRKSPTVVTTCTVRTILPDHPTHNLTRYNAQAEAHSDSDRVALERALRAAGYRLVEGKRPISQLLYLGRHLIDPAEPAALTIVCHRCQHQHDHPYTIYDGGPVRPSHIPDFM